MAGEILRKPIDLRFLARLKWTRVVPSNERRNLRKARCSRNASSFFPHQKNQYENLLQACRLVKMQMKIIIIW